MLLTVTKIFGFEAAHNLPHYDGACHQLHGHSYKLHVTVTGDVIEDTANPKCGMIIDFKDLKAVVKEHIIDRYDHSNLNDHFFNPTAENMVVSIANTLICFLPEGIELVSVKLWETDTSYAEYTV